MANIEQLICSWSGWPGAPGYSVFYGSQGGGAQPTFATFWNSIKQYLPVGVAVTVPNTGRVIDEVTGKQNGAWTSGTVSTITGTAASSFAPQAGALVQWLTNVYANGKRIRGRTNICPISAVALGTNGQLLTATQTAIAAAADTLWRSNGTSLKVWHRPVYTGTGNNAILTRDGAAYPIILSQVPLKLGTLRSRRDV